MVLVGVRTTSKHVIVTEDPDVLGHLCLFLCAFLVELGLRTNTVIKRLRDVYKTLEIYLLVDIV